MSAVDFLLASLPWYVRSGSREGALVVTEDSYVSLTHPCIVG